MLGVLLPELDLVLPGLLFGFGGRAKDKLIVTGSGLFNSSSKSSSSSSRSGFGRRRLAFALALAFF